jgi:ABC-type xylose transport system permease subunit
VLFLMCACVAVVMSMVAAVNLAASRSTTDAPTQAAHLGGALHQQTVAAFAHAVADGYRTVAAVVLLIAVLIAVMRGHRDGSPSWSR